jgi:hypothetical protein
MSSEGKEKERRRRNEAVTKNLLSLMRKKKLRE